MMPARRQRRQNRSVGAAEIRVLHGQRRKRVNFESVSTSAIVSRKRIRLMRRAGFLFLLFSLLRSRSFVPRKSTIAISPSTLITRLQIKSNWPSSGPVNTGRSTPSDLDQTHFISLYGPQKFSRAMSKAFPRNSTILRPRLAIDGAATVIWRSKAS